MYTLNVCYVCSTPAIKIKIWTSLGLGGSTARLPDASIKPSVISYNATISACEKGRQWQLGLQLFDAMPKANMVPDIISYSSTLRNRASSLHDFLGSLTSV